MKEYELLTKVIVSSMIAIIVFLPIILTTILRKKKDPLKKYTSGLVLYLSTQHLFIGLLGSVVGYIFTLIGIYGCDLGSDIYFLFIFIVLALAGTYICICCMLEVIILESDSLTIVSPMRPENKIYFYELSHIRYYENRTLNYYLSTKKILEGYINTKKVFSIDEGFSGFFILYYLLVNAGKIEKTQIKEEFVVTEHPSNMLRNFFGVVFFGSMLVAAVVFRDEVDRISCLIILGFFLLFISVLIRALLWKITVTYSTLHIRGFCGQVSLCSICDITTVIEEQNYITLYSGKRKVVKVCKDYKNFELLQNRLENENIMFYRTY